MTTARTAHHLHLRDAVLRGGRMTKWNGVAASFAPEVGAKTLAISSSALAFGLALAGTALAPEAALAGGCSLSDNPATPEIEFICTGAATPVDVQQSIVRTTPGGIAVTTTQDFGLTANAGVGISLFNNSVGDIVFTDNFQSNISGATNGINARNNGIGALTINASGAIVSTSTSIFGNGLYARNGSSAAALTINVNNVISYGGSAINAVSYGSGAMTITTTGAVMARGQDPNDIALGISAIHRGSGTSPLSITTGGATTGRNIAITANRLGGGDISVTTNGETIASGSGISVFSNSAYANANGAGDISVTTNHATTGGSSGIGAQLVGSGSVTVTANADVTGLASQGISVINNRSFSFIPTGTLLINQAAGTTTTGATHGIFAENRGGSVGDSLIINALGTTIATSTASNYRPVAFPYAAIFARNSGHRATDLIITSNVVRGGSRGIVAYNGGIGALSITTTGETVGQSGSGIVAQNGSSASSLSVTTGDIVTGGVDGIEARNFGQAGLMITANADVTGRSGVGILAFNSSNDLTNSMVINQAAGTTTTGGVHGIYANNNAGSLTINALGTSIGNTGDGIHALNNLGSGPNFGTDLTIVSSNATGGRHGVYAINEGSGALTVTSTGNATGTEWGGIHAQQYLHGTDLTVVSNHTSGDVFGIYALNLGSGVLSVTSTGTARGTWGAGIIADQRYITGSSLEVTSNDAFGSFAGIAATNSGTGSLSVTSNGTATATGSYGIGIRVSQYNGTSLDVTANNARAPHDGIRTRGYGTGPSTITVTGAIEGGTGAGINTFTNPGSPVNDPGSLTTINVASTARVGATSGLAIRNNEGNSVLNVADGAVINGAIQLGEGSDVVNLSGANVLDKITVLDGGDDAATADGMIDTLNLNAGWSGSLNGANTTNWEVLNINGGTVRFSDAAITAGVINVNGGGTLDGSNNLAVTGNAAVSTGSRLIAGNASGSNVLLISGNLTNAGTVDLRDPTGLSVASDRLTVGGNYTGTGGTILLDAVLGGSNATDQLLVGGNLTGTSSVTVNNVGGSGSLTTGDGIRLVQVDGTSTAGALTLAGGAIDVGAFRYGLFNGGVANPNDQDWYLRSRARDIVAPTISMARVAQDMALTSLGTLHERVGEQEQLALQSADTGFLKGMWGRAIGKNYSETTRSEDFGDSRSNNLFGGLQMGVDVYRRVANGSRTHLGLFGGHLWSGSDELMVSPFQGGPVGQTRSDGWMMGGYMTHYTASNFYVDAVIQHDWIDHRASATDGTTAETRSRSLMASVEVGRAFGTKWKFEPQAQLIYSTVSFDRFKDSVGIANMIKDEDSGTGRLGLRLKRTYDFDENSNGGLFTIYGKANVWHRIDGGTATLTVGVSSPGIARFRETWGDVGVGTTFSLGQNAELFADAEVEYGIDQGGTALNGRAGIRVRF